MTDAQQEELIALRGFANEIRQSTSRSQDVIKKNQYLLAAISTRMKALERANPQSKEEQTDDTKECGDAKND